MDANLSLTFLTPWHMVSSQILYSWKSSYNKRQCGIGLIYANYKLGTQNAHGVIPHYTLKKCNIPIDMWPCWINSAIMKECVMDPTLDNKIVRNSK